MSLDLYLNRPATDQTPCPHCNGTGVEPGAYDSFNITHNLTEMAREAGIYECLWRAKGTAGEIVPKLRAAIEDMRKRPEHYRKFDSENGWGTYDDFLPWLEELLAKCEEHPDAILEASV